MPILSCFRLIPPCLMPKGCVHYYDMYLYNYSFKIKYKICNHNGVVSSNSHYPHRKSLDSLCQYDTCSNGYPLEVVYNDLHCQPVVPCL